MAKKKPNSKSKKKKKGPSWANNILLFIGLLSLGVFLMALGSIVWYFIADNSITFLIVSGITIIILLIIGVLSKKRIKKAFNSFIAGYKG